MKTEPSEGTQEIMAILNDRFEGSLANADTIINQVMKRAHEHEHDH